ncbi:MAG: SdrD B-like domain-containing protein [Chloroflexota bacterium]
MKENPPNWATPSSSMGVTDMIKGQQSTMVQSRTLQTQPFLFNRLLWGSLMLALLFILLNPLSAMAQTAIDKASINTAKTADSIQVSNIPNGTNIAMPDAVAAPLGASTLGDFVWHDLDADGCKDSGEPGINGVLVHLFQDLNGNATIDGGYFVTSTEYITSMTTMADPSSPEFGDDGYYDFDITSGSGEFYFVTIADSNFDTNGPLEHFIYTSSSTAPGASQSPPCTDHLGDEDRPVPTGGPVVDINNVDFGYILQQYTLGDVVWFDQDLDGVQDGGAEEGVPNITVALYDDATCSGTGSTPGTITTTTTITGFYQFTGLTPGDYCVQFSDIPSGWDVSPANNSGNDATDSDAVSTGATTAEIENINLTADDPTQDMGIAQFGSIAGLTWCESDTNENTTYDAGDGDTIMPNITVDLFTDDNCDLAADSMTPMSTTSTISPTGYLFNNLLIGLAGNASSRACYVVQVDQSDPELDSCDNIVTDGAHDVELETGSPDSTGNDFGFTEDPVYTLGDTVWYDQDRDGIQDAGEPGVPNITAELFNDATCTTQMVPPMTTTTTGAGFYQFTGIITGTYCVQFSNIPAGWSVSPIDQGVDDTADSDAVVTGDATVAQITNISMGPDNPDEDMGIYMRGSIAGLTWCENDTNQDTDYDAGDGDTLLPNISVNLFADIDCNQAADSGTPMSTTVTANPAGTYLFDDLEVSYSGGTISSCYVVQVDDMDSDLGSCDNLIPVTNTIPVTLTTAMTESTDNDFGFTEDPVYTLGDYVWYDLDQDGEQDGTEQGVPNIVVNLYNTNNCSGSIQQTMTTTSTGFYQFTNLPAGDYCIQFTSIPTNWTVSPSGQGGDDSLDSDATITADATVAEISGINLTGDDPNQDVGLYMLGSISGLTWCESGTNQDTDYDAADGDTIMPNITVNLYEDVDCDSAADSGTPMSTTSTISPTGYLFDNLVVGLNGNASSRACYVVEVDQSDGDLNTCNNIITDGLIPVELSTTTPNDTDNDFGFTEDPVYTLGDTVWYDDDQDGEQDTGEPGVSDITVELFNDATCTTQMSPPITTTTTGAGFYQFTGLVAGTYCVQFSDIPANWTVSPSNQGGDDAADSDATVTGDATVAQITSINLTADNPDEDMGLYMVGSIDGLVWCESDTNADTDYDAGDGDTLLPNISVSLFEDISCDSTADGGALASMDTLDPSGEYSFTNLAVGYAGSSDSRSCYVVQVNQSDADLNTCSNIVTNGELPVELDTNTPNNTDNDFGFTEDPVYTLGDTVWYDQDQDGVQDPEEPGVPNITVELFSDTSCTTTTGITMTTNANGFYQFTGLAVGGYCLEFSDIPTDWDVTQLGQGTEATDNDATMTITPTVAQISNINLTTDDPDQDMGLVMQGSIGGLLWCESDTNSNTTYDAGDGDTLQTGVLVSLLPDGDCNDVADSSVALDTQDSDGSGQYLFTALDVGYPNTQAGTDTEACYVVRVDTTDGDLGSCDNPLTPTDVPVSLTTTTPNDTDNDFGFTEDPVYTLGDTVWYDIDQDGVQDAGEPGVENITVTLYATPDCSVAALGSTTTNASGFYQFTGLPASAYCVEFSNIPTDWSVSPANQTGDAADSDATVTADPTVATIESIILSADNPDQDMGIYTVGSIEGLVWCESDTNANTTYDFADGDTLTMDVAVSLYEDTNCDGAADGAAIASMDTVSPTASYLFNNLPVGLAGDATDVCYVVAVDTADDDLLTCDSPLTPDELAVTLDSGNPDSTDNDFGFTEDPVYTLGDLVWYDTDQDGQQDPDEPGQEGIDVTLYNSTDCSGTPIANTTTNASGAYEFTGLVAGDYCVEFSSIPTGWSVSPLDQGTDDTDDSDAQETADPTIAQIPNISLTGNNLDQDMGLYVPGSIGGLVWCESDTNENTTYDAGDSDTLISGVLVELFEDTNCDDAVDGAAIASMMTADGSSALGSGEYLFENLFVGPDSGSPVCYVVEVDETNAALQTCENPITDTSLPVTLTVDSPNSDDQDFGFSPDATFTLGDRVWEDNDQDGVQDPNEQGVPDITVTLYDSTDCSGTAIDTATTDANGFYEFIGLTAGDYCIEFSGIPTGLQVSPPDEGPDDITNSDAIPTADPTIARIPNITLTGDNPNEDMGLFPLTVNVGDFVWEDMDGDGIQDGPEGSPEPGVAGVVAHLFTTVDGNQVDTGQTATTDANGEYLFENLIPGDYFVVFDLNSLPTGYVVTPQDAGSDDAVDSDVDENGRTGDTGFLPGGDEDLTLDMGIYQPVSIGDMVWEDLNGNGLQDAGEPGIQGVPVTLHNADGTSTGQTTTTDADGQYLFDGLPPGSYYVVFGDLTGYIPTIANVGTDDTLDSDAFGPNSSAPGRTDPTPFILSGGTDMTLDMGVVQPVSVGNFVWLDSDQDGIQDEGETGVGGVSVALFNANGDPVQIGGGPLTSQTSSTGFYVFSGLPPGEYSVVFDLNTLPTDADYVVTTPNAGGDDALDSDASTSSGQTALTAFIPSGGNDMTLDMGIHELEGIRVGDVVWLDANANGTQEAGETGVSGIGVELFDAGGNSMGETATDTNGNYLFEGVPPNSYYVEFDLTTLPDGFLVSPANVGSDDQIDSDAIVDEANQVGQTAATPELVDGDQDLSLDMGVYQLASIGDRVWIDINGNSLQDPGELGLGGVTVNLLDGSGNPTGQTTTTAPDGSYGFIELEPGVYIVEFAPPEEYAITPANISNNDAVDSDADPDTMRTEPTELVSGEHDPTWDAGVYVGASIGNFAWDDVDGNGVQNDGEVGVGGVVVQLFTSEGVLVGTTSTDATGFYLFEGLLPGDYYLQFVLPPDKAYTRPNNTTDDSVDSDVDPILGRTDVTTLSAGEFDDTWDVGFTPPATISQIVWIDQDQNGLRDEDEPGIANMVVNLYNEDGDLVDTTVTDGVGAFEFTNLTPGEYSLEFMPPAGFNFTEQSDDLSATLGSDADPLTGVTAPISLEPGESNVEVGAGLIAADDTQGPTAIALESLTVMVLDDGVGTMVEWVTGEENETFGFHLYRSTDGDRNNAVRVTDQLIASQGAAGGVYQFTDTSTVPGVVYVYWLREVETSGKTRDYGPVGVQIQAASLSQVNTVYLPTIMNGAGGRTIRIARPITVQVRSVKRTPTQTPLQGQTQMIFLPTVMK